MRCECSFCKRKRRKALVFKLVHFDAKHPWTFASYVIGNDDDDDDDDHMRP